MRQLPKDKRNRLILVILITASLLAGLWFGLIGYQQKRLQELAERRSSVQTKLDKVQQVVKNADFVESETAITTKRLSELEEDMVTGDPYAWMYSKMKEFKASYKVDMPQLVLSEIKEVSLLPKFPYKQARFTIGGTAFYHDLGRFVADFENHFPLFRVLNLDLTQAPLQADTDKEKDKEKLTFKMEIIPLVKSGV
jgi:Tfp pilus assembly protein PilO